MYIILLLIFIFSPSKSFTQNSQLNCDSIFSEFLSRGHYTVESAPELQIGLDSLWAIVNFPNKLTETDPYITIYLLTIIDTMGFPICIKILRGLTEELDLKSFNTVAKLKFTPAYHRKVPIEIMNTISVRIKVDPIEHESFFYGKWWETEIYQIEDSNYLNKKNRYPDSLTSKSQKITFRKDSVYLRINNNEVSEGKYWIDVVNRTFYMSRLDRPGFDRYEVFYKNGKLILRAPSGKYRLLFSENE